MTPSIVPPEHVTTVWLQILPYIRRLTRRSEGRIAELQMLEDCISRTLQLWIAFEETEGNKIYGFAMTRLPKYPTAKLTSIDYVGGEKADTWIPILLDAIESWSKELGNTGVEVIGRLGWEKFLQRVDRPFIKKYVVMERKF
jgi:hypothetical protein